LEYRSATALKKFGERMKKLVVIIILLSLMAVSVGIYVSDEENIRFSDPVPEKPVIEVLSPERGIQVLFFDQKQTVKWTYWGFTGKYMGLNMETAAIFLQFLDGEKCYLGSSPSFTGRFSFTLKEKQPCGSRNITPGKYKFVIVIYSNSLNEYFYSYNNPIVRVEPIRQISPLNFQGLE